MGGFVTGEAARERFRALADQVESAYAEIRCLSSDEVGNEFRVEMAEHLATQERSNRGLMYRVFGEIADPPDQTAMVPAVVNSLAGRLRRAPRGQTPDEGGRAHPAAPPTERPAAAPYHRRDAGREDRGGSSAGDQLGDEVERSLVREAAKNDADIVSAAARRIDEIFNPDGDFDEEDRARRRGLTLGGQGPDGMSRLAGFIDPETRAYLEAVTAAVRQGRHRPDGSLAETRDDRSGAQRCHDGVKLGLKAGIASGGLGAHRGHAVTVIVRTTLAELDQAAHAVTHPEVPMPGPARTGGDSALPMREVIRMAADSIHYLAVFHEHTGRPIDLGRQARIATADQRIICYANECFGYAL